MGTAPNSDGMFRDRIKEIVTMRARDLMANDGNWRVHPALQKEAVAGILREVGKADVLKAYYSTRAGNQIVLLDGHLRKDLNPDEEWRVAVLDFTDAEADKFILFFDPLAGLATTDKAKQDALIASVNTDNLALRDLMRQMQVESDELEKEQAEDPEPPAELAPTGMALQPFEHYDYLVLFFKTTFDFERALDFFGVQKEAWFAHMGGDYLKGTKKVGVGRALDGEKAMDKINAAVNPDRHSQP